MSLLTMVFYIGIEPILCYHNSATIKNKRKKRLTLPFNASLFHSLTLTI